MKPNIEVFMIDTHEAFQDLEQYVAEHEFDILSLDLETDSKHEKTAKIYGIGLSFKDNEAFYIPVRNPDKTDRWDQDVLIYIYDVVAEWCKKHKVIGHNIIYDCLVFENNSNINISSYVYSDTILLKHTLYEERPFGLKECSVKYLGEWADKAQEALYASIEKNGGSTTKDNLEMYKADTEILGEYCGWDTVLCRKLFDLFEPQLKEQGLWDLFYVEEIMPLYKEVTMDMKRKGFHIDLPYFEKLKKEITHEIQKLEKDVMAGTHCLTRDFCDELINKNYKISNKGSFPKVFAEAYEIPLPLNKEGAITLAKKFVENKREEYLVGSDEALFYDWVMSGIENSFVTPDRLKEIQLQYFYQDNPESRFVFNLNSTDHLGYLFFTKLGEKPLSKTEGGKGQVDDEFLQYIKDRYDFVPKLIDYKKLMKLSSTYIDGILERQIDGIVYTSMLQFGTTSGRYSSRDPNLQNIPRVKDDEAELSPMVLHYTNAIKRGFIAPPGYVILNADYSSLEPMCFAEASGDEKLRDVFRKGYDLYSAIAIEVFGIEGCSANKKDKNYLKNIHPEKRQLAKIFCFTEGTKVDTVEGVKSIEKLKVGDHVATKFGPRKITNLFKREEVPTIKFITNHGAFTCTPDHKIWSETDRTFKEAGRFEVNELIEYAPQNYEYEEGNPYLPINSSASFKNGSKKPLSYLDFTPEWAYIVGAFLGDGIGSYTRRKNGAKRGVNSHLISSYVGICGLKEDLVVNKFKAFFEDLGYKLTEKTTISKTGKEFKVHTVGDFELVKIFQETLDLIKNGKKNLKVPDYIFNSSLEHRLAFLAGLLDTDGYLKCSKTKVSVDMTLCSKNSDFIGQVSKLVEDMGAATSIRVDWNKTYKKYYYLCNFMQEGIYKLAELGLSQYLIVPRKKEIFSKRLEVKPRKSKSIIGKVVLVEPSNLETVYDITVEGVHEFYANNIRVHNCLAVVYGAEAGRISEAIGVDYLIAEQIIENYLDAYPELRKYMLRCDTMAKKHGYVKSAFGRVRHLPIAKELYTRWGDKLLDRKFVKQQGLGEIRYKFKNTLNNSKNFPIQAMAAHIVNRAALAASRKFRESKLDASIIMQVHDEVVVVVKKEHSEEAKNILRDAMENTTKISMPLKAEPLVANNWADAK